MTIIGIHRGCHHGRHRRRPATTAAKPNNITSATVISSKEDADFQRYRRSTGPLSGPENLYARSVSTSYNSDRKSICSPR
ncbi:hypothetical protein KIN20_032655 [Parelaphostrongylus tenuis]|uniref:Uncharacterized protein n=1 Tax=Parelaphostrongylus tenuis TaxID=148309 RepID=A0AAD5R7F6_PARTN|nr:hypothetical protein KIN20_032655 [Parelaphostrongylus tenuis]